VLRGIGRFIPKWWLAMLRVPTFAGFGYLWLILWFAAHQRDFQYTLGGSRVAPGTVGLDGFAAVEIPTEDGERIVAWWGAPPSGGGVVLFLHGTPSTLPDTVWRLPDLRKSGLEVMAIDYGSSTCTPSERGLQADARAAFDFIHAAAPESRIAVFGESLGTGIAVALAHERPVAGVLLNAPYASVLRLFELRGPPLPYRLLLTDQFDSEALIGGIGVPVMILHGTSDDNIPITEARPLYATDLRQIPARRFPDQKEVTPRPHAREAAGGQGMVAAAMARADPGHREMARPSRRRLFRLPRRADEQRGDRRIPLPCHRSLALASLSAQSEGAPGMAADGEVGRRLLPQAADPSSLAQCALRRQTPEVGAECPNWARSDLCGGRSAMSVPTANA
jgi:pimeloyl-ACP methyl ester carboxylesterase